VKAQLKNRALNLLRRGAPEREKRQRFVRRLKPKALIATKFSSPEVSKKLSVHTRRQFKVALDYNGEDILNSLSDFHRKQLKDLSLFRVDRFSREEISGKLLRRLQAYNKLKTYSRFLRKVDWKFRSIYNKVINMFLTKYVEFFQRTIHERFPELVTSLFEISDVVRLRQLRKP